MFSSKIAMALVAASLVALPAQRVSADAGDVAAGVLLGVIGSAAVNSQKKKKKKVVYVDSAKRAETREVQTALNYFGFPAGTPDGVSGRKTRNAISTMQVFLGYPATGQLTEFEKQFLVGSYHRAVAGGAATAQLAAANPNGARGLLKNYQQEAAGLSAPGSTGVLTQAPAPQQAPANNTVIVVAPKPAATPAAPTLAATGQGGGALPNFMAQTADTSASLASHCNKVSLITSTNGGFVTQASMADANFALAEQFCLARTYAIATGEELAARVQGFTPDQIAQQCGAFGPALKDQVAALSLKPQADVLRDVGAFVLSSGMSPAQLTGTAKICLSVGYRTDDLDVALGSALLLSALGEPVYGELMGHHLSQGFGTNKRADLSLAWYQSSLDALDRGAQAAFAPAQPERSGLIRQAALQLNGQSGQLAAPQPAAADGQALPSFGFKN